MYLMRSDTKAWLEQMFSHVHYFKICIAYEKHVLVRDEVCRVVWGTELLGPPASMNRFNFLKKKDLPPLSPAGQEDSSSISAAEKGTPGWFSRRDLRVSVRSEVTLSDCDDARSVGSSASSDMESSYNRDGMLTGLPHSGGPSPVVGAELEIDRLTRRLASAEKTIQELRGELYRIQAASPVAVGDKDGDPLIALAVELSTAKVQLANAHWQMESKVSW